MAIALQSHCKVNLILNILGRRADGFHALETVMQPIPIHDRLSLEKASEGIHLTCSDATLPTNEGNLVYRAAQTFLAAAGIRAGVRIHLEKKIPLAAGLGGGSGNAATTLLGLNELFGHPVANLQPLAAELGSDVPFFLQNGPALAVGRGETVQPLAPFPALRGRWILLIHPGFGVSTAWAYQNLARYPAALNGQAGRAQGLIERLGKQDIAAARADFYNSLEAPVLTKYPLLAMFQEHLRAQGADVALMSGSGSTTFAIFPSEAACAQAAASFRGHFGNYCWMASVPLS